MPKPFLDARINDAMLAVAASAIPGISSINKFGRNIEVDSGVSADVWDGGYTVASGGVSIIWVAPTQARVHNIVSSDVGDTSDGLGAKTIRVYGLTSWSTREVYEDVIMDGTTPVATTNSYVIIHRMRVLTKGATAVNIGIIKATAVTDDTITAQIRAGIGQTNMAIYGVPSIQDAYMTQYHASMNKSGGAVGNLDASVLTNPEPDAELTNFIHQHTHGFLSTGSSHSTHAFKPYFKIRGPAIIKIHVHSGTNNLDISAGFDLFCLDNV